MLENYDHFICKNIGLDLLKMPSFIWYYLWTLYQKS